MKRKMRTVTAFLLLLVMLFTICATTVAAAPTGTGGISGGDIGSLDPIVEGDGETNGSIDLGWFSLGYRIEDSGSSIDVVWYHNLDAMFEAKPEHIEKLVEVLTEGIKNIVFDSLKGDSSSSGGGDPVDSEITKDNVWEKALDAFLDSRYQSHGKDAAVTFFKELFDDQTGGEVMIAFSEYACGILRNAVRAGVLTLDDVVSIAEDGEALKAVIGDQINLKIEEFADQYVGEIVSSYITYLKNPTDKELSEIEEFVQAELISFIRTEITKYINSESTDFSEQIGAVIDSKIESVISTVMTDYLDVKLGNKSYTAGDVHDYAFGIMDSYVKQAVQNYINAKFGDPITSSTVLDGNQTFYGKIDELIETEIGKKIDEVFDAIVDYVRGGRLGEAPDYYAEIEAAFNEEQAGTGITFDMLGAADIENAEADFKDEIALNVTLSKNDYQDILVNDFDSAITKLDADNALEDIIGSANKSDVIDAVIAKFDRGSSDYKDAALEMVSGVTDSEILEIVTEALNSQNFDVDNIINKISSDFSPEANPEKFEKALAKLLGLDEASASDIIDGKIETLKSVFANDYDATLEELRENPDQDLTIEDLISYLQSVTVNGNSIISHENDSLNFNMDALKAVLEELPKPSALATMKNEEMAWTWTVEIVTDIASASFDLNLSVGAGYDGVRALAKAFSDFVSIYAGPDGTLMVDVNLFDSMSNILKNIFEAPDSKLSKALKIELFDLTGKTVDQIYNYFINDFTFADYSAIIKVIDFEAVLADFTVTQLTNQGVVDIINNEYYFNRFKSLVEAAYSKLPDNVKSFTLKQFYSNNGVFKYAGSYSFNVADILNRIGGKYPTLIAGFIGDAGKLDFSINMTVNAPKLNRVEFYIDDYVSEQKTFVKEGFLPEGVDLTYMYGSDRYEGYKITEWTNADGTVKYTEMPAEDIVIYGKLEKLESKAESDVPDEEVVFDEEKGYTLEAEVVYNYLDPAYNYQWYLNGELVDGATGKTHTVKNVSDSGTWYCKIRVIDGDLDTIIQTNDISVSITPKYVFLTNLGITWDYEAPFTFIKDTEQSVNIVENSPIVDVDYYTNQSNKAIHAAKYTAEAVFKITDSNYALVNGVNKLSLDWEILPKPVSDTSDFVWKYTVGEKTDVYKSDKTEFVYANGELKTVWLQLPEYLGANYIQDSAGTQAREYEAVAEIYASDSDYVWVGENVELKWEIKPLEIDLSKFKWDYNSEEPAVYDGEEHKVELSDTPAGIIWIYTDNVNVGAGEYVSSAEPDPNALTNNNYSFKGEVPDCKWQIKKATLSADVSGEWNYTEAFVYNTEERRIELVLPEDFAEGISVSYSGNAATNAGQYTATATLTALDADNFEVVGETVEFTCDWEISKATIDMSGISFRSETVTYDGTAHSIAIKGTLPSDILIEYSPAKTEVGTYEMTVNFIVNGQNYEPIAPMSATLTILPVYEISNNFDVLDSDGNVIVKISAANGITSNNILNVKDLTTSYMSFDFGNFFGYGKSGKIYTAYDINFAQGGTVNPVEDVFTVKFAIPSNFNGDINNLRVAYIADNGEVVDMDAIIDGEYIAFETYHFSVYAIVEIVDTPVVEEPADLSWLPILLIILLAVIIVLIIVIIVMKKRRGKGGDAPAAEDKPEDTPDGGSDASPEEAETEATEEAAEEIPEEVHEQTQEEAPAEEPAEEAAEEPVKEVPAEEPEAEAEPEPETEDAPIAVPLVPEEVVRARFRSSFMSRLIQSEPPIQDYYTILKNALLSYKGVKARMSWNFESFNNARTQCAKLNVKGKNFLVYLALKLDDYNANKYHFTDASDKPKFENVPMMLKVKSERSLRYALELIDEVMKLNGFEKAKNFAEVDYHMPYATVSELAERELVKVILPAGVKLTPNMRVVFDDDVGAIIDEANAAAEKKAQEEE